MVARDIVLMSYTCKVLGSPGTIGNEHTVAYPPELIPDNAKQSCKSKCAKCQ